MGIRVERVSELEKPYPKIYKLVFKYQMERDGKINPELNVDESFWWEETEEGEDFWHYIHEGRFEDARNIHPHLFDPPELEIKNNGLWL